MISRKRSIWEIGSPLSPDHRAGSSECLMSTCPSRATRSSPGRCLNFLNSAMPSIRRSVCPPMRDLTQRRVRLSVNGPGLLTIAALVAVWELIIRLGIVRYEYLPAPTAIVTGLFELISGGQLAVDTVHTLQAVMLGWVIAVFIGVMLGLLMGISPTFRRYSLASVEVLRPMPGIA